MSWMSTLDAERQELGLPETATIVDIVTGALAAGRAFPGMLYALDSGAPVTVLSVAGGLARTETWGAAPHTLGYVPVSTLSPYRRS